jgi:hypothetical protein
VNIVAELTIRALRAHHGDDWSHYRHALITACKKAPPPFGTRTYGDIYRDAAVDPYWMATSLMTNAHREGEGAGQLWDLAACTPDARLAAHIRQHAIDESGHAHAYLTMLDLTFPDAVDAEFRAQLATLSPGYTRHSVRQPHAGSPYAHPVTLDELIQMNIAEIRTRVHHLLQRPMLLAYCGAPERRGRLQRILDVLLADETRHIAYTAALIEEFARDGEAESVTRLMQERLSDFNSLTINDLGRNVFEST